MTDKLKVNLRPNGTSLIKRSGGFDTSAVLLKLAILKIHCLYKSPLPIGQDHVEDYEDFGARFDLLLVL